jgi:hypothetical protein
LESLCLSFLAEPLQKHRSFRDFFRLLGDTRRESL